MSALWGSSPWVGAGCLDEMLALGEWHTAKQFVFEGEEELECAGVALSGSAADELAVDAFGGVQFGGDDVQAPGDADGIVQHNIGAASGLVVGDGDSAGESNPLDNLGLHVVEPGVW